MSLNLFYLSPITRKTVFIEFSDQRDIDDLRSLVSANESIPENHFKLYSNGKLLESSQQLSNDSVIYMHFGLNGGKGGFGSMLRAIGAQIEKTTNREACRDLSGRRLRDINEEKRIKDWISKEKQRKDEMEKRRKEKLERMALKPKTEFNDQEFEQIREAIPEMVDEALQYGLRQQKVKQQIDSKGPSTSGGHKRKADEEKDSKNKAKKKKKKVKLWIGEDIDLEDDSDSD